jgi:hypothetical protein
MSEAFERDQQLSAFLVSIYSEIYSKNEVHIRLSSYTLLISISDIVPHNATMQRLYASNRIAGHHWIQGQNHCPPIRNFADEIFSVHTDIRPNCREISVP